MVWLINMQQQYDNNNQQQDYYLVIYSVLYLCKLNIFDFWTATMSDTGVFSKLSWAFFLFIF